MSGYHWRRMLSKVSVATGLFVSALVCADQAGNTPLILAAWRGDATKVESLLRAGAEVNASNSEGLTALIASTWNNRDRGAIEIATRLLANSANPNARTLQGRTALMEVAGSGNFEFATLLLANGADVNVRTSGGGTALQEAALNNHANIVRALLIKGAKPNDTNELGQTPLMMACNCSGPRQSCPERAEIVKLLIDAGANVNAKDAHGFSGSRLVIGGTKAERDQVKQLLKNAKAIP